MRQFNLPKDRKIKEPIHRGEPGYTEVYPLELSPEVLSGEKQITVALPEKAMTIQEMIDELNYVASNMHYEHEYEVLGLAQIIDILFKSIPLALTADGKCPTCGGTDVMEAYEYTDCNMEDEWVNEVGYRLANRCHECDQTLKEDYE